jgi:asparagine synthase (glutamine-hydrolysing)
VCGIAGFSGRFSEDLLQRMGDSIAHRGPDDSGVQFESDSGIGLVHRRLSIIDLSPLGRQPMWDLSHTVAIVFNGEIYNYRELRQELVAGGFAFRSNSDTEVLLNLYLRDGEGMLGRLNGIFAFALWDPRDKRLFLARDGVGVKPLYCAESRDGFLFASELKALLQVPSLDRRLDPAALLRYMTFLWCPAPDTALASVKKLEPGHAMVVREGRVERRWRHYDLPNGREIVEVSAAEAARSVGDAVRLAVERQMVADVPVGAFLSGGLDSSAVVAFAKKQARERRLQCFTIGFDDDAAQAEGMTVDLPFAQKVARHLDVDLHVVRVGPEMADELPRMLYHLDEPQADPAPLNALFISRLARERGIKVLLSGAGGDDIFTGYRRHYALLQERYWSWLPQSARCALAAGASRLPASWPPTRRLAKAFQYAGLDRDERLASYFYWTPPALLASLCGPVLRESLAASPPSVPLLASLAHLPEGTRPLERMLYLEGKHFLADHNLNYTDKMGMAAGVEVRVPLLDPDLMALAATLPENYKQHGRIGKWIFKRAMEPYLPRDVIYRPKTGFGAPLRQWLRRELAPLVADLLSPGSLQNRGLFDLQSVTALVEMDRTGRLDGTYTIFSLMCIELWCRIFIDGKGPSVGR